jgi:hypothetical protein
LQPVPSADQFAPSHRAMLVALVPPAEANAPPATMSPLASVTRASTTLPTMPVPSGCRVEPSHRAMPFSGAPWVDWIEPPTIMSVPLAVSALTSPVMPWPFTTRQMMPS